MPDYYEALTNGLKVYSFSPTPQADVDAGKPQAPCTQVHMHIPTGFGTIVMRFKGTGTIDDLIAALQKHREDVWGKP